MTKREKLRGFIDELQFVNDESKHDICLRILFVHANILENFCESAYGRRLSVISQKTLVDYVALL